MASVIQLSYIVHGLLLHGGHLLAKLAQFFVLLHVLFVIGIRFGLVDDVQEVDLVVVQAANKVFCACGLWVLIILIDLKLQLLWQALTELVCLLVFVVFLVFLLFQLFV